MSNISLSKTPAPLTQDGRPIRKLRAVVSWQAAATGQKGFLGRVTKLVQGGVDLDVIMVAGTDRGLTNIAWSDARTALRGALSLGTDERGKRGGGEASEMGIADFQGMPSDITTMGVLLTAFKPGTKFSDASETLVELFDDTGGTASQPFAIIRPTLTNRGNAMVLFTAKRGEDGTWNGSVPDAAITTVDGSQQASILQFAGQHVR
jgi:hypothetical protein